MPAQLTVGRYNPKGYVPGGASRKVAAAIQKRATLPKLKPIKPKPVVPYLSGGAGGLATNPIFKTNAALNASVAPPRPRPTTDNPGAPPVAKPTLKDLIAGDWEVQAAETDYGARMDYLRSALGQRLRQALIGLGVTDASKLGQFGSYLDPETIRMAAANKYSTTAQIAAAEAKNRGQMEADLAARGGLGSGQFTKSSADIGAAAEKSRYDALQAFLSGGEEGLGQLSEEEYRLRGVIANANASAAERAAEVVGEEEGPEAGTAGTGAAPVGVNWGGQTFTTKAALAAWLSARGASYATWAANHPSAAARLK